MEITNIKGNTHYIKGGTNTGLYIFDDNIAMMIDPGLNGLRPKKIIEILKSKNIILKYIINTHEHDDHFGATIEFKEHYKDIIIISSSDSKLYIENPELFFKYIVGGKPDKFICKKQRIDLCKKIKIDMIVNEGIVTINGKDFEIIGLPGHTPGTIGIMTSDKILFIGDVLVGDILLNKYDFLFLFDIEEELKSLEKLKQIDFEYVVLGHGKEVLTKEESFTLIKKHEEAIEKYIDQVRELLKEPISVEKVLKHIIIENNLTNNYKEYHFFRSSLISIISYLSYKDEIEYILSEGDLLYYTKRK